jgi:putative membrane protein (TIGR04086 family)
MEDNYRNSRTSSNYFLDLLKTVAVSLIITFIILLIAALLICFTDFPEKYTMPSAIAGTILGVFAGSNMAARKNPEKSLTSGILTAFVYTVLAYIIGCIIQAKITFTLNTLLFLLISVITGIIASILATRAKSRKKYDALGDNFGKKRKSYNFGKSGKV